jgi:DNA adenine methylase
MPSNSLRYLSPLRYPGGKAKLAAFVGMLIAGQTARATRYVEPFAGGGGVGLRLLFDEHVDEIVLNDLNPGVAAFWRALFETPELLAELIRERPVTVDEWHRQSEVYRAGAGSDLDLGFATLFLNRTNRSGILDARPIGGYDQTGNWKIDARYNVDGLVARVLTLASYASRVTVTQEDGVALTERELGDPTVFVYADPPYLVQGDRLYLDAMLEEGHSQLSDVLREAAPRWLLTYDADSRIKDDLYRGLRCAQFFMTHTAAVQRTGSEYAVFPDGLVVPSLDGLGHREAVWL